MPPSYRDALTEAERASLQQHLPDLDKELAQAVGAAIREEAPNLLLRVGELLVSAASAAKPAAAEAKPASSSKATVPRLSTSRKSLTGQPLPLAKLSSRRSSALLLTERSLPEPPAHSSTLRISSTQQLGEGTSGQAFLVDNPLDQRRYCVKSVPLRGAEDAATAANEARLHARCHHPSIVKYCYSWLDGASERFHVLMELCASDLWACLEAGAPRPGERLKWSAQLSGALAHIHDQQIVHRDLNPWNCFVTAARDLKVADFGLSAACAPGAVLRGEATPGAAPLDASAIGSPAC